MEGQDYETLEEWASNYEVHEDEILDDMLADMLELEIEEGWHADARHEVQYVYDHAAIADTVGHWDYGIPSRYGWDVPDFDWIEWILETPE
jgi:hypothetical protein